jgi:hypothetical protein
MNAVDGLMEERGECTDVVIEIGGANGMPVERDVGEDWRDWRWHCPEEARRHLDFSTLVRKRDLGERGDEIQWATRYDFL